MSLDAARDQFTQEVSEVFHAERQLVDCLPDLIEAASEAQLIKTLAASREDADKQIGRLERVARYGGLELHDEPSPIVQGLIKDCLELVDESEPGPVRDAGIVAMLQKLKHLKIASYGSLLELARQIAMPAAVLQILDETVREERAADRLLSQIAEYEFERGALHAQRPSVT